ncbi:MAG: hypothetical protein QOJ65_2063 [Fimbriimonadaceae bacterium]|jgi:hypothetical protein|nr:hypothetical protein [Fimbriimonadaceae bacterium]
MKLSPVFVRLSFVAAVASAAVCAHAQASFYAASDRIGYTGTIKVYNTLAQALTNQNPRFVGPVPQRDLSVFVVHNAPTYYLDSNFFLTNWFSNGGLNPNNVNEGFVQIADSDASTWLLKTGYWHNNLNSYTLDVVGRNATYNSNADPQDLARLWNAGVPPTSGEGTKGTFLFYQFSLTANGLNGADPDNDGFYTNTTDATSYSGAFNALFKNTSTTSPASNGYYVVSLKFNNVSWAVANTITLPDEFGSNIVVRRRSRDDD